MKRILVFEFVCGGGCYAFPSFGVPRGPLYHEGQIMLQAILDELLQLPHVEILVPLDSRIPDSTFDLERTTLVSVGSQSELTQLIDQAKSGGDLVMVIAPEIENALSHFVHCFSGQSERLLNPGLEVIELCSDKWTCFQWMESQRIATPETSRLELLVNDSKLTDFLDGPVVVKPRLGAGSNQVTYHDSLSELISGMTSRSADFIAQSPATRNRSLRSKDRERTSIDTTHLRLSPHDYLVQRFVSGLSASISVMRTSQSVHYLPAMQHVMTDGTFEIQSFEGPLGPDLQTRAKNLIEAVVDRLPEFRGYLSIDIVLGHPSDASEDYVIEINPRLTTSFSATRKLMDFNLYEELLG